MPNTTTTYNPQLILPKRRTHCEVLTTSNPDSSQSKASLRVNNINPISSTSEDPPIPRNAQAIIEIRNWLGKEALIGKDSPGFRNIKRRHLALPVGAFVRRAEVGDASVRDV